MHAIFGSRLYFHSIAAPIPGRMMRRPHKRIPSLGARIARRAILHKRPAIREHNRDVTTMAFYINGRLHLVCKEHIYRMRTQLMFGYNMCTHGRPIVEGQRGARRCGLCGRPLPPTKCLRLAGALHEHPTFGAKATQPKSSLPPDRQTSLQRWRRHAAPARLMWRTAARHGASTRATPRPTSRRTSKTAR